MVLKMVILLLLMALNRLLLVVLLEDLLRKGLDRMSATLGHGLSLSGFILVMR